jgi:hypothetical protein
MAKYTEWNEELETALAEPFPPELHKTKDRFGTFVSVRHYVERLNELVGVHGWSMDAPVHYRSGNKLGLAVGVTILGVTKWNVGDEMEDHGEPIEYTHERTGEVKEKVVDFGSSSTNSWAQAFKRCCAYGFSMGLYLYDKDRTRAMLNGGRQTQRQRTEPPADDDAKVVPTDCPKCGSRVWDNRAKKASGELSPKWPDFKCREKACDWVQWGRSEGKADSEPAHAASATSFDEPPADLWQR